MDYYIGIDIGTTSTKAVAFNIHGEQLAKHSIGYELNHPQPNWSELKPIEILEAVIDCLINTQNLLPNDNLILISFCAFMHSIIAVDKNDRLLTDCIIWADNRAVEMAETLADTAFGKQLYHKTGVPVHAMSPLCKLLWLRENNAVVFKNTCYFIGIKEYVFFNLFGNYSIDTALASATGLLNINTLKWDRDILNYVGIDIAQLPELVRPEQIFLLKEDTNSRLKYFNKIPFIIGGSDGGCANLGSGAIADGTMAVTIGTSGAVRVLAQEVYTDAQARTFCYHVKEGAYIIGGATNNGAVVLQWLNENILQGDEPIPTLLASAETIRAAADGLLFLPYLLGERAPLWNANAKAVFFGMSISHTKAHFVRAAMEGVLYNLYAIGKILLERKKIATIYASGGFAKTEAWVQMLSDIFNLPVYVTSSEESTALGAVIIGWDALKLKGKLMEINERNYQPNFTNHLIYQKAFNKFQRICELLKGEMD